MPATDRSIFIMDAKSGNPKTRMKVVVVCALMGCLLVAACIPSFLKYLKQRRQIKAITPEQLYQFARSGDVARLKWILERRPDLLDAPGNTFGSTALQAAVWFSKAEAGDGTFATRGQGQRGK